jgi:hypothetical protein
MVSGRFRNHQWPNLIFGTICTCQALPLVVLSASANHGEYGYRAMVDEIVFRIYVICFGLLSVALVAAMLFMK